MSQRWLLPFDHLSLSLGFFGSLIRTAQRQHQIDVDMRAWNDMDCNHFADLLSATHTGFDRGLDRRDVAADNGSDETAASLLVTDQLNFGGFDHCIAGFDYCRKTFTLDHA